MSCEHFHPCHVLTATRVSSRADVSPSWDYPTKPANALPAPGDLESLLFDYVVQAPFANGAMGTMYLGKARRTGQPVAIKLLQLSPDDRSSRRERFQREWQVISQLRHPNVVRGYSYHVFGDICCLVMEHVDGPNLQSLVCRRGPLPVWMAARLVLQAADGLTHAHAAGVVHRDIKPSNLLLAPDGVVKVIDFGVALISSVSPASLTLSHQEWMLGTADFMAPEQSEACHEVDVRADLYSLGCTLYYLLAGEAPFSHGTVAERLMKHRTEEPPNLLCLRSDLPQALASICQRLMAKSPADRYPDAAVAAGTLHEWLEREEQNRPSAAWEEIMQTIDTKRSHAENERIVAESCVNRLMTSLRKALFINRIHRPDGQISRRVYGLLEELRDELALYFSLDEAYGELSRVGHEAPRLGDRAMRLEAECDKLFQSLSDLCERVDASCNSAFADYFLNDCERDFNQFEQQFLDHQHRIVELVITALYDDIGVGD